MTSPTPIGRQSLNNAAPNADSARVGRDPADPRRARLADIVQRHHRRDSGRAAGADGRKLGLVQVPPTERLPDAIGGPVLRAAALKGDPTAAYEIGVRFAEGKGVAANFDEAAKWYDRAAQAGVVPAIFRLGTFYEKGLSVKKDVDIARRYYLQAAERGNAKAMHNLAVLDADGGGKGANYKSASQWFRKAADRGVADSQFNLGILYARGIGVEQNLAEVLQMVQPGGGAGRRGLRAQARRYRQAARRPVAGGGKARDPDLHAGTAARRRHQRGEPAPADGTPRRRRRPRQSPRPSRLRPNAPPVNLNYSPRRKVRRGRLQKKPPAADSLVPPAVDFGYAEARQLVRAPKETMP